MNIKLTDKHTLRSDGLNIWIEEEGLTKKGTPCIRNVTGYHGTLQNCLNTLVDRKIRELDANTLAELCEAINTMKTEIKSVCAAIKCLEGGAKRGGSKSKEK